MAAQPFFHAHNLEAFIAGKITDDALEPNKSIYDRYVASLPAANRARAEAHRLAVIGKPIHHRAKHGVVAVHDPLHTLFLVPGSGDHPGLPGNYLHGAVFHVGDEATGAWVVHVHDAEDGASLFKAPTLPETLAKLEEVLASAPFHLRELDALGFCADVMRATRAPTASGAQSPRRTAPSAARRRQRARRGTSFPPSSWI